jgi:hypothetical protein
MRKHRGNGFELPLHWQQVFSWGLTAVQIVSAVLFMPLLAVSGKVRRSKAVFTISYFSLMTVTIWLAYKATHISPTDVIVKLRHAALARG